MGNRLADEFNKAREDGGGIKPTRDEKGNPLPGVRPFPADPGNLKPIQAEIDRVKAQNQRTQVSRGMDMAMRRREGQLRRDR